jgi:filamentous hemagglutinin
MHFYLRRYQYKHLLPPNRMILSVFVNKSGHLNCSSNLSLGQGRTLNVSVNLGAGFSAQGKLAPTGTGAGFGKDSDSNASITHAGISGTANGSGKPNNLGDATVRTGDKEAEIAKIFDADKVQKDVVAQTQITQMFSTLAPKAVKKRISRPKQTLSSGLR